MKVTIKTVRKMLKETKDMAFFRRAEVLHTSAESALAYLKGVDAKCKFDYVKATNCVILDNGESIYFYA